LIKDGDWLAFGDILIQICVPDADQPDQTERQPQATSAPSARNDLEDIVIGRSPGGGLPIDSPLVSREHARLILRADGVWLEDLKCIHGTWFNGRRPASSGQVASNGLDIYRSFDLFRFGIGYVPPAGYRPP
jgi:hypothetical protein